MIDFDNKTLQHIIEMSVVLDTNNQTYPLEGNIDLNHINALYRTVREYQPRYVVEIGLANGISSLVILSALAENGQDGLLISIDPYQTDYWHDIGRLNIERAGLTKHHQVIEQPDYKALPHLLDTELTVDFAYIDGWHTFDYVLLDFFYIDKLLKPTGVIGLNDCGYRAIHKVLKFVQTHRKYKKLDVGLKPDYKGRNVIITTLRTIMHFGQEDQYFQKQETWEPAWNYFKPF